VNSNWDTYREEVEEMKNDPAYWAWLNSYNKSFTEETNVWYNITIDYEKGEQ